MEELLFQVQPFWIDRSWLLLIWVGALFYLLKYKKKREWLSQSESKIQSTRPRATLPSVDDREFEKKIRLYILDTYSRELAPIDGETQTAEELRKKLKHQKITSLYEKIETHLYSGKSIDTESRKNILKSL